VHWEGQNSISNSFQKRPEKQKQKEAGK